ncbi:hypothetical protein CTI14_32090, partial [Methylobacterium radiotolerans]
MLSLGLLLPACGTTPQGAPTQAPAAGSIVATPDECATFDQYPMVVARVAFNTERDFYDLATTFEFLGGTLEDRYVLLDLSKKEYEQLKVTGLTRGWKVEIDQTATKRESAALDIVAAGGTVKNELSAQSIPGYSCYRTVEETYQTMDQLAAQYPNLVTVKSIGPTWLKKPRDRRVRHEGHHHREQEQHQHQQTQGRDDQQHSRPRVHAGRTAHPPCRVP